MRVLVTGVDGYIGSLLGPYLLMRGHDVVGLDTGYYRAGWLYPANVDRPVFLRSSCIYPKFAPQPIKEDALLTGPLEAFFCASRNCGPW